MKGEEVLKESIGENEEISYCMIIVCWRQAFVVPVCIDPSRVRYSQLGTTLASIISLEEAKGMIRNKNRKK